MALVTAESKIPALLVSYLTYRRSDADYPVPGSASLSLVAGPVKETTARATLPTLEIWCPGFSLPDRRDNEMLDVFLDLHCSSDTSQATEDGWLAAIRRAFAGGPISQQANATNESTNPFFYWLQEVLTETEPSGWRIDDFHLTGGSIIREERHIIRRTEAKCSFRSYVFTV